MAITENRASTTLGHEMRAARERRGLSADGAAAQARVSARVWDAVETFGSGACTTITLQRILDWLDA